MRVIRKICCACILLTPAFVLSQTDNRDSQAGDNSAVYEDRMVTPPPVSGEAYPTSYQSEARSNYLEGGLNFSTAYTDNVLGGISEHPISDVSYSVWPTLTLDQTRSRMHWLVSYAPGFTFYQRTSARNEADNNLALNFEYRLSPHVTLKVIDSFRKSSNVFNQVDYLSPTPISGSIQAPEQNFIPPIADQVSNNGSLQLTYQFRENGMVGVTAAATDLYYPNPGQVPGVYNSSSRGGSSFYAHRLSGKHYIGASYQYQLLRAFPTGFTAETQTHSAFFFYTAYLKPTFTVSVFGGPQYAITQESLVPPLHSWSPGVGASLGWQARETNLAVSYSRTIASGGGLVGAVHQDAGNVALRQQLNRLLSVGLAGNYTNVQVLDPLVSFSGGGHMLSGTASIQRQVGEHFGVSLGYTRLHETYSDIGALSGVPDINREWVSITYQFARPVGR